MNPANSNTGFNRRDFLRLSTAGATALATGFAAGPAFAEPAAARPAAPSLYADLLRSWCDGLIAHQVTNVSDPASHGAFLCPSCAMIHGRCGDAVYPLLAAARATGQTKYVQAAIFAHDWSERQVSQPDGSWINDVMLSSWKGITVFRAIALAEALAHHGDLLDAATRARWTGRLAAAMKFLDGFISIETGNINYPVTASLSFALAGQLLEEQHYLDRGHELAHASLDYFTPGGLLYGEGHPFTKPSAKGYRPVDLGYNVEESLPALALYSIVTGDQTIRARAVSALRAHLEFMLPDGAWDNSWGTRNYKWSWWGSRTSDGCQPGYVLLSKEDPAFLEAARRNTELMAACTHDGLLYGGPDYFTHGDLPCIHHTFTHAKALATVLDRADVNLLARDKYVAIPRDAAFGLRSYKEIGMHLASIGDWRATLTDYDWEYTEPGSTKAGGHATGGALTMLYHQRLGPVLVASMTEYQIVEISNQQAFRGGPHMDLTARIEMPGKPAFTSVNDRSATLTARATPSRIDFEATGRLLTAAHAAPPQGDVQYQLAYALTADAVEIAAEIPDAPGARYILPIVSRTGERVERIDSGTVRIRRRTGSLVVHTDAPNGFHAFSDERTFNLVPGFECLPLVITFEQGRRIKVQLRCQDG
ncbi:twin-arginine translocation signal domain-containing protein [Granulicella rosea]|uniref:twin-arginine translocation signal domain-containing protein n=1 Tax=Granulicella rosea TaxID=474952 RepID=UPI000B77CC14|nr:twin-arginine translocation signal domain-containing protein [Granulicella rosea]